MKIAYLGLGTNLGDKEKNLKEAIRILKEHEGINIIRESSFYITEPVGYENQPDFLNAVVQIETNLSPFELLEACRFVENELKRERIIRWGPRIIDVDILLYEDLVIASDELSIPHPRMHERKFVLEPLAEIAPNVIHPSLKITVKKLLYNY